MLLPYRGLLSELQSNNNNNISIPTNNLIRFENMNNGYEDMNKENTRFDENARPLKKRMLEQWYKQ